MSFTQASRLAFLNFVYSKPSAADLLRKLQACARFDQVKDIGDLKAEINRLVREVKNFDIAKRLGPEAAKRLTALKTRYEELVQLLRFLQRQLDERLDQIIEMGRSKRQPAPPPPTKQKKATRKKGSKVTRTAKPRTSAKRKS